MKPGERDSDFLLIKRELVDKIASLEKTQAECARAEGAQIDKLTIDILNLGAAIDRFTLELKHRDADTDAFRHEIKNKLSPIPLIVGTEGVPGHGERIRKLEGQFKQVYALWTAIVFFTANTLKDWWIKSHGG